MSPFLHDFHFLRPWWLLALAALPLLWRVLARSGTEAGAWRGAVDAHLLRHLLDTQDAARTSLLPRRLAAFAWIVACLALAGPAWERLPQPLFENRAARVFALELSPSMSAQDLKPSRYERARFKLDDMLARSAGMQTALIAYAGDAFVVAPLTDDVRTVTNLVDALDPSVMPADGNDTGRAIDLGASLIRQAGLAGGEIVVLADSASADAVMAARRARAAGIRVSVLGVGTDQGAPVALAQGGFLKDSSGNIVLPKLGTAGLQAVARAGGGDYAGIRADSGDIAALLAAAPLPSLASARAVEATTARFLDRGPWLVLLLLPLAALGFRRGWLALLPLVLLVHPAPAQAFSWRDLWQRPDSQARAQLDAGHAEKALALAHDPALRGAAAYRAGDYKAAEEDFAQRDDAQAQYNRGNALAKQQEYQQAIAAYEDALRKDPQLADAQANKKAIEDWLKQQQKQQQQNSQNAKQNPASPQGGSQQQSGGQQDQKNQAAQQDSQKQSAAQQSNSQNARQQDSGKDGHDKSSGDDAAPQRSAREQAKTERAEREAGEKFRQDMNRQLQKQGAGKSDDKPGEPKPVRLGAREGDARQNERDQAVEQWLARVPDDPGGLLRRKFRLEYEMRRNGGHVPADEGE
ncbi:MAG: VWA domain-containing protein [Xanthomonadaceae bacterium]|nr:VWA domain-containing protein [Xanthomonadaceae bacterium]MDE1961261.1 VWA domain-containing protein [Xanthomonadaceae bacterium]MDE2084396.1 VWA domain-containing protein [Xanthomonadaceae bacterium]MDE2257140.1 VWA domain-containing protein [Xanthomonadaceae bacterium]